MVTTLLKPRQGQRQRQVDATELYPDIPRSRPIPNPTFFVGRERELRFALSMLQASEPLSIWGSPGMGKSSLVRALIHKEQTRARFGTNMVWIDVGKSNLGQVYDAVARALSCWNAVEAPTLDKKAAILKEVLSQKPFLVVLGAIADGGIAASFTHEVSHHVLATSIGPIPDFRHLHLDGLSPSESEGVLRHHLSSRSLTQADKEAIQALVKHLRGWPLALALAAGALTSASKEVLALVGNLAAELQRKGLQSASSGRNPHKVLDATIKVGLDTLDKGPKLLLYNLQAFKGWDFGLEAAQRLMNDDGEIQWFTSLVRHHFIEPWDDRYELHRYAHQVVPSILSRQEQGGKGEAAPELDKQAAESERRLAEHFISFAKAHPQPARDDYHALEVELSNIVAAARWAALQTSGTDDQAIQWRRTLIECHDALRFFQNAHGHWQIQLEIGKAALDAASQLDDTDARVRVNLDLARAREQLGHIEEALQLYSTVYSLALQRQDQQTLSKVTQSMGTLGRGDNPGGARAHFSKSLEMSRKLGNQWSVAACLVHLASLARQEGSIQDAQSLAEEALTVARSLGDISLTSQALSSLTQLAEDRKGIIQQAKQLHYDTVHLWQKLGRHQDVAVTLRKIGTLALEEGLLDEARRLFEESLQIEQELKHQEGVAECRSLLGTLAGRQGTPVEAISQPPKAG